MRIKHCLWLSKLFVLLLFLFFANSTANDKVFAQTQDCTEWWPTVSSLPSCSQPLFQSNCNGGGATTGTQCCNNLRWDYCESQTINQPALRYHFRCCNNTPPPPPTPTPTPTPTPFSCTDQYGLSFACFSGSCPANWVSSVQNPNTTCASSGQTCCWYNPPAPPTPTPTPTPTPVCVPTPDSYAFYLCSSCNYSTNYYYTNNCDGTYYSSGGQNDSSCGYLCPTPTILSLVFASGK